MSGFAARPATSVARRARAVAAVWVSAWLAAACSGGVRLPPVPPAAPPAPPVTEADCAAWFSGLDAAVAAAGTGDGQYARLEGFPHLRASRFLAAVEPGAAGAAFEAWAERLRRLDAESRVIETRNAGLPATPADIALCGRALLASDLDDTGRRERLARVAAVPDDYSTGARLLGLYALTSAPFSTGVHRLHVQTRERFSAAARRAPLPARVFVPDQPATLSPGEVAGILVRAARNPLGIPEPAPDDLSRLFRTFAPTLALARDAEFDRIGTPSASTDGFVVDTTRPRVYTLATHTLFEGRALLQLVYVAWFTERPRTGPLDLLGGRLDGIVWRVTLDGDGRPLLYDVAHACGCYHMAFPGPALAARDDPPRWQEPLLVPARAPPAERGLTVGLQSATHYVESVTAPSRPDGATSYELRAYDELRALPLPGGASRSLFREDGIVAGSERAERWLFWPMGVPEPGAMRQWGRHAVAFVGRRHLDDADLLERWFVRVR